MRYLGHRITLYIPFHVTFYNAQPGSVTDLRLAGYSRWQVVAVVMNDLLSSFPGQWVSLIGPFSAHENYLSYKNMF